MPPPAANGQTNRIGLDGKASADSAAAVRAGRSIDTSMGLTPLEGLVMGETAGRAAAEIAAAAKANPGLYSILGTPDFCAPVIKAVRASSPEAQIVAIDRCILASAAKAIPGGYKGVKVGTTSNLDKSTEDVKLLAAALDKYNKGTPIESNSAYGWSPVLALARALNASNATLTPQGVTDGLRSAPPQEYPLTNGIKFQCDGKAFPLSPNICSAAGIVATADEDGKLSDYQIVDDATLFKMPPR